MSLLRGLARGAAAGAAGTTALNCATYLDMAARGRGTSSAPEDVVEKTAEKAGVPVPGEGAARDNRLAGLGPLSGSLVGVGVGAIAGAARALLHDRGRAVPGAVSAPLSILAIGAAAMALADVPMKVFGISDPAEWSGKDWAADAVPHLLYGATTYATLVATEVS